MILLFTRFSEVVANHLNTKDTISMLMNDSPFFMALFHDGSILDGSIGKSRDSEQIFLV